MGYEDSRNCTQYLLCGTCNRGYDIVLCNLPNVVAAINAFRWGLPPASNHQRVRK